MILEWDVLFYLVPSVNAAGGTVATLPALNFNSLVTLGADTLGYYMLDSAKCQSGAGRRITRTNIPQADGEITHRKFKTGYVVELNAQLWERIGNGQPACGGVLRQMADTLNEYLEAIANNDGQLIFFPRAWPVGGSAPKPRLLDAARSLGPSGNETSGSSFVSVTTEKDPEGPLTDVSFALLSPFPYLSDFMNYPTSPDEVTTWSGSGQTILNAGNTDYFPIIRVYGPADGFTIFNYSIVDEIGNPLAIVYDDTLPGAFAIPALSYVEIDTFRNTAILHNPGGGTDNAKRCISALDSDYWFLAPGNNDLFLLWFGGPGTQVEVIWRNAWI